MNKQTKRDLYLLGMQDAVLTYFTTHGPYKLSGKQKGQIFYADFSTFEDDLYIATNSVFTDEEMFHLSDRLRDESRIYHRRGQQAGRDLIGFLIASTLFERHIRGLLWFRLYYRTKRIFRKAFALMAFWRYTWVVRFFHPKHHGDVA